MPAIDVDQLIGALQAATSQVLKQDVTRLQGFSQDQLRQIGEQVQLMAEAVASGELSADDEKFFAAQLEASIRTYEDIVRAMVWVEVERLWNALAGVVSGALDVAIGPVGSKAISMALSLARSTS